MTDLNAGEVEITLDGSPITLKPSLAAATAINAHFGGFKRAMDRMVAMDMEACAKVIRHGAAIEGDALKLLPERVYRTGMVALVGPVTAFVSMLSNGGKPFEEDQGGAAPQRGNAPSI